MNLIVSPLVTNGVDSFQRVINEILEKERVNGTFAYVDNVTVCDQSKEDHDENLKHFLDVAQKYNLTLDHDKCDFSL